MINVVLFEPEIPENVGNIARTCVAFNAKLHLIRPYGFIMDLNKMKRSSTNHWKDLHYNEYDSYEDFMKQNNNPIIYIYTRYGDHAPDYFDYTKQEDIFIMFGRESTGINVDIIKKHIQTLIRIPMSEKMVSINIANTVAIAVYEIIKQKKYIGLLDLENHKKF